MRRFDGFLVSIFLLAGSVPVQAEVNRIVLRVNDRIATSYDYQIRRAERVAALQRAANLTPAQRQERLAKIGESVMSELFDELLVLSRADQLGVRPSTSEIASAVQQTKKSYGIESDEEFNAALQSNGMTLENFREQMRTNLMIRQVMGREVRPRINLEEEDLRRYYQSHRNEFEESERLKLREVIVLESSGVDAERMGELASEIYEGILSGVDLDEAVEEYVEQGLVTKPIDLGWVDVGDLDRDLEEAVWGLETGAVSSPVLARGGLHLIQVVVRKEARLKPFSEVQGEIQRSEGDRRYQEELQKYMDELEARSYIVANPPPEAASFRRTPAPQTDPLESFAVTMAPSTEQGTATQPVESEPEEGEDKPPAG